jgi:uncharacterized protein YqiB (DUF1249 family)
MQAPRYPWSDPFVMLGRPTVGALMSLCEENYRSLMRLVPDLKSLGGELRSAREGGLDLHLEIIEQSPYTSLLRLTYFFPHNDGQVHRIPVADPDALLRVYHDAGQVEVLDLRQTILPIHRHYQYPALETKWRANLFLAKWLAYCLRQGHGFVRGGADEDAAAIALSDPC